MIQFLILNILNKYSFCLPDQERVPLLSRIWFGTESNLARLILKFGDAIDEGPKVTALDLRTV